MSGSVINFNNSPVIRPLGFSDAQWQAVLAKFDKNGDGKITGADGFGAMLGGNNMVKHLQRYDTDKNGEVSQKEQFQVDYKLDDSQWSHLLGKYDTNGDGKIDQYNENITAAMQEAFQLGRYDLNKDNTITDAERFRVNNRVNQAQFDSLLKTYDKDNDGNIDPDLKEKAQKAAALLKKVDANGDGKLTEKELKDLFNSFDLNRNGKLGKDERKALSQYLGIDLDKDGLFNKYKFDDFMKDVSPTILDLGLPYTP